MAHLTVPTALEDTPRTKFLQDFNLAFANGNANFIIKHVSKNIEWIMYGDKKIIGKEAFIREINIMKEYTADELVIHNIISQNNQAVLSGEMKMGEKTYAFCDIYTFESSAHDLIKQMNSYVIQI